MIIKFSVAKILQIMISVYPNVSRLFSDKKSANAPCVIGCQCSLYSYILMIRHILLFYLICRWLLFFPNNFQLQGL